MSAELLPTDDGAFVKPAKFFMVWNKEGGPPRVRHHSRTKANREAIRLAKKHPGHKFIVLAGTDKFWIAGERAECGPSPELRRDLLASVLLGLLREAMDSRGPDLADAEHPGWSDRAREAIAQAEAL